MEYFECMCNSTFCKVSCRVALSKEIHDIRHIYSGLSCVCPAHAMIWRAQVQFATLEKKKDLLLVELWIFSRSINIRIILTKCTDIKKE